MIYGKRLNVDESLSKKTQTTQIKVRIMCADGHGISVDTIAS